MSPKIPTSEFKDIFLPFYRGNVGIESGHPGQGLGSYIKKKLWTLLTDILNLKVKKIKPNLY